MGELCGGVAVVTGVGSSLGRATVAEGSLTRAAAVRADRGRIAGGEMADG